MQPLKLIAGFLFWCLVIYGLLLLPWHGLKNAYRAGFRTVGNVVFHSLGRGGSVYFEKLSDADRVRDTTLRLTNRRNGVRGSMDVRTVYLAYRPTAFLVALVLATPMPWSRRGWALLWGFAGVSVFVLFRTWLQVLNAFSNGDALSVYAFSPFWKNTLTVLLRVLVRAPEMSYIVPVFIWMLVAFRRGDWAAMADEGRAEAKAKSGSPTQ